MVGYSLIILPDQEKWSGDGAGIKAITGGVSRRRVILPFPDVIPANERDPQLLVKIAGELAVIVRHLMKRFTRPDDCCFRHSSRQRKRWKSSDRPIRWSISVAI